MTDDERCLLIARFEFGVEVNRAAKWPDCEYDTDLRATMRAALRLPKGWDLGVLCHGVAWIEDEYSDLMGERTEAVGDPARAAFLALSDYLAKESAHAAR